MSWMIDIEKCLEEKSQIQMEGEISIATIENLGDKILEKDQQSKVKNQKVRKKMRHIWRSYLKSSLDVFALLFKLLALISYIVMLAWFQQYAEFII